MNQNIEPPPANTAPAALPSSTQEIWESVFIALRSQVNSESLDLWLKPVRAVSCQWPKFLVEVPNRLFAEHIQDQYKKTIEIFLSGVVGMDVTLEIAVNPELESAPVEPVPAPRPEPTAPEVTSTTILWNS